ncbi:MAG: TIGR02206 family membrane protein [Planctomycetota bacterium]|nr:TIGR02206 family membrane protein [Planctomycetota bacterium]
MLAGSFQILGPDHQAALVLTLVVSAVLVLWARRRATDRGKILACRILAAILIASEVYEQTAFIASGSWTASESLPVDLCDLAAFVTVAALWTRRIGTFELAYFWGFSGTLQAILTPGVAEGFPAPDFIRFFAMHSSIIVSLLYLTLGLGLRPRRGAVWRVYGWTVVYAVVVGLIDWAVDGNYFYLCRKPEGSLLDLLGPWPWYIFVGAGVAALMYWLLDLPYRRNR